LRSSPLDGLREGAAVASILRDNRRVVPNSEDFRPDSPGGVTVEHEVVVRRSPRYFRFMLLGALVGVVVTLVLTFSFPEQPQYSRMQVFGFVGVIAAAIGIALGALVAMLVDRLSTRRSKVVTMQALPAEPVEFAVVTAGDEEAAASPPSPEELLAGANEPAQNHEQPNDEQPKDAPTN
jgi:hypothetical protein